MNFFLVAFMYMIWDQILIIKVLKNVLSVNTFGNSPDRLQLISLLEFIRLYIDNIKG